MKIKLTDFPVMYINLDSAVQNNVQITRMFKDFNFTNVSRISAFATPENYLIGNNKSFRQALSSQPGPFIIFEDDAFPYKFINEIDIPDDADALYLAISDWGFDYRIIDSDASRNNVEYEKVEGYDHLVKIYNGLTAHAILYISDRFIANTIDKVNFALENRSSHLPAYDRILAEEQYKYNVYAMKTPIFCQHDTKKPWQVEMTTVSVP